MIDGMTILIILFAMFMFGYLPHKIAKWTGYYDKKKVKK